MIGLVSLIILNVFLIRKRKQAGTSSSARARRRAAMAAAAAEEAAKAAAMGSANMINGAMQQHLTIGNNNF